MLGKQKILDFNFCSDPMPPNSHKSIISIIIIFIYIPIIFKLYYERFAIPVLISSHVLLQ